MREVIEFRIPEELALRHLRADEGVILGGSVRKYEIDTRDPRFIEIGRIDAKLKAQGQALYTAWIPHRYYSKNELKAAELFQLKIKSVFEPTGEERGTIYDESIACSHCGAGAVQSTDLFLNWKRIPKNKDISKTIGGEIVVSRRMVELCRKHGITEIEFNPIRSNPASSAESKEWFQLLVVSCKAEITAPTKIGIDPFDEDIVRLFCCPLGDLSGLNVLSEVWLNRKSYTGYDIVASKQFLGSRCGLLRPERLIFISPKLQGIIDEESLRGMKIEMAYLL